MEKVYAAASAMFKDQTIESFLALVEAFIEVIFGYVASEEGLDYTPVA